jgi:hypothetical protein
MLKGLWTILLERLQVIEVTIFSRGAPVLPWFAPFRFRASRLMMDRSRQFPARPPARIRSQTTKHVKTHASRP